MWTSYQNMYFIAESDRLNNQTDYKHAKWHDRLQLQAKYIARQAIDTVNNITG